MKNLLIIGVPRSGKTTLAGLMCERYGFSLVSIDALVATFGNLFPELGVHLEPEKSEPLVAKFVFEYVYRLNQEFPERHFVIEGCHISPQTSATCSECDVVCLGYPELTAEQFLNRVRQTDWAASKPDDEILQMGEYFVGQSKQYSSYCQKNGIHFIDTSTDMRLSLEQWLLKYGGK